MNRFLGVVSTRDVTSIVEGARAFVGSGSRAVVDAPTMALETTDNGGTVLGRAERDGRSLVYLGMFHHPAPDFGEGNPLDDPDRTALYLLGRFEQYGPGFLDGLCGHFVVAVAEPASGRLTLARDPGGSRRLLIHRDGATLRFATKLSDFRGLLGEELRVDRGLEDFLLGYEFLPNGRTLYAGVEMLPAGQVLTWTDGGLERRAIPKPDPWGDSAPSVEVDTTSIEDIVDALDSALLRAIEDQLPSCNRIAVLMGGFDSMLIASLLTKHGKEVETFSFHYADDSYNQPYTEELAQLLGTKHNWVPIDEHVMREGLEHFATRFNQLSGQPHYLIASAHAVKAAADKGFRHVMTGDGCDGLFLGYPTVHLRAKFIMGLSKVAPLLKFPLGVATRSPWLERRLGHPYRVARNVSRILERDMPTRAHVASCVLDSFSLEQLRGPALPQDRDTEEILTELARGKEDVGTIRLAYQGRSYVGLNKNKLEGAGDLAGVTITSPFLHPGMARFAATLPDELSRPAEKTKSQATGKFALMQMAERKGYLPTELIYQTKRSPVTAPVDQWYLGPLRDFMLSRLDGLPFEVDSRYAASLLSPKLSEDLFRDHVGISRFATHAINVLVTHAAFTSLATRGGDA